MQVAEDNQLSFVREIPFQVIEIYLECFGIALKALDIKPEISSSVENETVRGLLDEDLVAGICRGGKREIVRHRGARSGDDRLHWDAIAGRNSAVERLVSVDG